MAEAQNSPILESIQGCDDPWFKANVYPEEMVRYAREGRAYCVMAEITSYCAASCAYCFASSDKSATQTLSKETLFDLIDFAREIDARIFAFTGGDALSHPNWEEAVVYARENGLEAGLATSWMISKAVARKIVELDVRFVCGHIDTIDPEAYAQVHTDPKTLEAKVRGLRNLFEAGYPKERIMTLLTITRPVVPTFPQTLDWYLDELGVHPIGLLSLKGVGFGNRHRDWEPTLEEYRQVHEYRASRMGEVWSRTVNDVGRHFCQTHFNIHSDGRVSPCNTLREIAVGNIFEENIRSIYTRHRDFLLFNYEIDGPCNRCENNEICFGCRANAYYYLKDVRASDPKCWWNPQAQPVYYEEAKKIRQEP